jgi:flagellar export protein FliJ
MPKFRLDRVIEVKNKVMDDKKKDLDQALTSLNRIEDAIVAVETDITKSYAAMTSPMGGSDFSVLRDFLFHLDDKKAGLTGEREQASEKLDEIRAELLELAKEIKMLDTLKSKALERERKLQNRKEQKVMDDMALRAEERR